MLTRLLAGCAMLFAAAICAAAGQVPNCAAWQDSFDTGQLNSTRWTVVSGEAPGYVANQHAGFYLADNVSLTKGLLTLTLTQTTGTVDTNNTGTISYGALVISNFKCGYGTYSWTMRESTTAVCPTCSGFATSGSVSAGFNYVNNSQTEIDFEFQGDASNAVSLANWLNRKPKQDPRESEETLTTVSPFDASNGFHTYTIVWSAGLISYYIDGQWIANHTTNVPTAPAYFMINHWGTDNAAWGGPATIGVPRYAYISHVSYTP